MPDTFNQSILFAVLFILIMITGYRLAKVGHKDNSLLFTLHKLAALTNLILIDRMVYLHHKTEPLVIGQKTSMILLNVFFLVTIVSGALMSFEKTSIASVKIVHKISPWFSVISLGVLIYVMSH